MSRSRLVEAPRLPREEKVVTPAQAGVQASKKLWIPVFTGMTEGKVDFSKEFVTPAEAGIQDPEQRVRIQKTGFPFSRE